MKYLNLIFLIFFCTSSYGQLSRSIQTKDGKIHYKIFGEGEALLIINGGPGFSSEGFSNLARELAAFGYKAILFDQRGTGSSTLKRIDSTTITLDLMVQDIELIRKDMGVNSWIIFGHSFGGMLANYYASRNPENVRALIHSSSGGMDLQLHENAQNNLYSRLTTRENDSLNFWRIRFREDASQHNRKKYYEFLASAYVFHNKHIPTVTQRLSQGDMRINRLVWNDMTGINFDCKSELKSFFKPVLILQGEQDILPSSIALTADAVFPNSSLFFLKDCGHYGWLDQKEEYLTRIKDFLSTIEDN